MSEHYPQARIPCPAQVADLRHQFRGVGIRSCMDPRCTDGWIVWDCTTRCPECEGRGHRQDTIDLRLKWSCPACDSSGRVPSFAATICVGDIVEIPKAEGHHGVVTAVHDPEGIWVTVPYPWDDWWPPSDLVWLPDFDTMHHQRAALLRADMEDNE